MVVRRRHLLALTGSAGMSAISGCGPLQGYLGGCPDDPITDTSISPDRRTIEFLPIEERAVESRDPPLVVFESANSRVVIQGVFVGATPKDGFPKDMILVNRLRYDEQSDTLRVRIVERACRSGGAGVGGETTAYELRVRFPNSLPNRVCVEERGDIDKNICISQ